MDIYLGYNRELKRFWCPRLNLQIHSSRKTGNFVVGVRVVVRGVGGIFFSLKTLFLVIFYFSKKIRLDISCESTA